MSPHGIAGSQNQSSPNSMVEMSIGQTLTVPNFVSVRQEVSEISAIENLCSPKKWTKVNVDFSWDAAQSP